MPSIYDHVRSHLAPDGRRLASVGLKLPDEDYQNARLGGKPDSIGFAPGATDGILRDAPVSRKQAEESAIALYDSLLEFAHRPNARSEAKLVQLMVNSHAATSLTPLLLSLSRRPPENLPRLYQRMRQLFLSSGHREVLKYAMTIMAAYHKPEDLQLFRTIGCHPEFTQYAVDAISKVSPDPVSELIALARGATGWGKVSLVERLSASDRPEVRDFLLKEGLENVSVLEGYVALPIATRCKLHEVLEGPVLEPEILRGAARILRALTYQAIDGNPRGNILDYADGGIAVERFLAKFGPVASSLDDYLAVSSIRQFAVSTEFGEDRLLSAGWDSGRRTQVSETCNRILARPMWLEVARRALASEDSQTRWLGLAMAERVGIPLHDFLVEELRKHPLEARMWFRFVHEGDAARMGEALRLAREVLNFESIATGPGDESFAAPGHERHDCVNYLLQELRRFPGLGSDLVRASLRSPVTTNRSLALRVLKNWRPSDTTAEVIEAVRAALQDPSENIRKEAREVLTLLGRSQPN